MRARVASIRSTSYPLSAAAWTRELAGSRRSSVQRVGVGHDQRAVGGAEAQAGEERPQAAVEPAAHQRRRGADPHLVDPARALDAEAHLHLAGADVEIAPGLVDAGHDPDVQPAHAGVDLRAAQLPAAPVAPPGQNPGSRSGAASAPGW